MNFINWRILMQSVFMANIYNHYWEAFMTMRKFLLMIDEMFIYYYPHNSLYFIQLYIVFYISNNVTISTVGQVESILPWGWRGSRLVRLFYITHNLKKKIIHYFFYPTVTQIRSALVSIHFKFYIEFKMY